MASTNREGFLVFKIVTCVFWHKHKLFFIQHKQLLLYIVFKEAVLCFSSGISMALLQSKDSIHYFSFEHSREYQQVQFKFLDAVESMDPNNIVVNSFTVYVSLRCFIYYTNPVKKKKHKKKPIMNSILL